MKRTGRPRLSRLAAAAAVGAVACMAGAAVLPYLAAPPPASSLTREFQFQLQPGWNAVYLEIRPEMPDPNDLGSLFTGLPLESIFTRTPDDFGAEFIQEPSETRLRDAGWLWFFPKDRPESITNTLHTLLPNRAYLIKLGGSATATWQVNGAPALQPLRWAPDAYTLTGLPVRAGENAPTAQAFFGPSPAHVGQPIYTLAGDAWQPLAPQTQLQAGAAYWVYTRGASDYQGSFRLKAGGAEILDFDETLDELELRLESATESTNTITITQLASAHPVPLVFPAFDANSKELVWRQLEGAKVLDALEQGDAHRERLAVRRALLAEGVDRAESVLEITDSVGTRRWLPVVALRAGTGSSALVSRPSGVVGRAWQGLTSALGDAPAHPGLWVGQVRITHVNQSATPATVQKTAQPFGFRMLVHVDAAGRARLLKQVIQMWQNGTQNPDQTLATPGYYVLLTDDALIPQFQGAAMRDGVMVGNRISTTVFNFQGDQLDLDGVLEVGQTLSGTIQVGTDLPTNPFRHRYHPDHDNLDAKFQQPAVEAFPYTREISLHFTASNPEGPDPSGWGDAVMGGTYRERIPAVYQSDPGDPGLPRLVSGLHENDLVVEGTFLLNRLSLVDQLNPDPQ